VLTISQLASYAGVTVRAVRHYHAKGLLPEPERDHSGYRRYDAAAVVELIRIRVLADAGVPLARVRELLAAGEEEFNAAVADIDRRLRAEIMERQLHRERIAQLAAGDSLALPVEAVAYLDRLRELGIPELLIGGERDAWILVAAQLPENMSLYMKLKEQQLDDPATVELYQDLAVAIHWGPTTRGRRRWPTGSPPCSRLPMPRDGRTTTSRSPTSLRSCSTPSSSTRCRSPIGSWSCSRSADGGAGPSWSASGLLGPDLTPQRAAHGCSAGGASVSDAASCVTPRLWTCQVRISPAS